jgi:hypothetical protein
MARTSSPERRSTKTFDEQVYDRLRRRLEAAIGHEPTIVVARRAGIPNATLSGYLKNGRCSLPNLMRIARATGQPLEYFLASADATEHHHQVDPRSRLETARLLELMAGELRASLNDESDGGEVRS